MKKQRDNLVNNLCRFIEYIAESVTPKYSYVLESIQFEYEKKMTIILYRIVGKRGLFDILAYELVNDDAMLSNFHPLDVKKICFAVLASDNLSLAS